MKKIITIILITILGISNIACSSKEVKIISGNSLDGIAMCKLAYEENQIKKGYKTTYTIESKQDNLQQALENKEFDIALVPTDMAAKVYNKNSDYEICASIGQGSYYLVSSDSSVTGFNSTLYNKEVAVIGKNSMIDTLVKSMLENNNVDKSMINFKYVENEPELVKDLTLGKITTGIVPETSLTILLYKHSGLKILKCTNEAYEEIFKTEGGYSQFSVIVRKDFAKENKSYVDEFLTQLKSSIEFVNNNPLQAGAYGEKLSIPIKPQVLSKAIARSNLNFIPANKFKSNYEQLFNILYTDNKEVIGGKIPNKSIYYK